MSRAPLLETRDVECVFDIRAGLLQPSRPLRAVGGVSLALRAGEAVGLVGESGCGKSTLANLLLGLEAPTAGEILLEGLPIERLSRRALARRIQPVFQDPYSSLNPRHDIEAIISLPLRTHRIGRSRDWTRKVVEMMDLVGLEQRLRHCYPRQLSGGQRQRVAIARALIMRPDIVICDEPTSALDVSVQSQILNLLQDLQEELGLTYLLISHNLAVVERMASRVAVMYLGRIVEEAATKELFARPHHPYTEVLLASVLAPDPRRGIPETNLGATYPNPMAPPSGCPFHPRCPKAFAPCPTQVPRPVQRADRCVECHLADPAAGPRPDGPGDRDRRPAVLSDA